MIMMESLSGVEAIPLTYAQVAALEEIRKGIFEGVLADVNGHALVPAEADVSEVTVPNVVYLYPQQTQEVSVVNDEEEALFNGTQAQFLKKLKEILCEDDYLEVLESIASFEHFHTMNKDIQDIVFHFFSLSATNLN